MVQAGGVLVGTPAVEARGVPEPVTLELVIADLDNDSWLHRSPRRVLVPGPSALGAGRPCFVPEAVVGDELEESLEDLHPLSVGETRAVADEVELPLGVVEPEEE